MVKVTPLHVVVTFLVVMGIAFSIAGCGEGDTSPVQGTVTVSYTLPIVPIKFSFDSNGHVSASVGVDIATPLGDVNVSVGAAPTTYSVPDDSLLITIRHQ